MPECIRSQRTSWACSPSSNNTTLESPLAIVTMLTRRDILKSLGISPTALPFLSNLSSMAADASGAQETKQRLVIVFTPDGVVKENFWPRSQGSFSPDIPPPQHDALPSILTPFESLKDQLLLIKGVDNQIRGDGDGHMRGMGCLLTGIELFPGNIQGGSHTPAGWASGKSIDQEIAEHLQKDITTTTRFHSLEFGVLVPNKADTWTRMVYAGPNKPLAPIDDPYQMFKKLYGKTKDRESLKSILDEVRGDLSKLANHLPSEDRQLLEEHTDMVRQFERELKKSEVDDAHPTPTLEEGIIEQNEQMPKISRMQTELLVSAFQADFTRVATLQFTNSVGQASMTWLGIQERQHTLSHKPNSDTDAQEKLTKINAWYASEIAHLAQRLAETPEPGGSGSMLDHTTILWTNELGEGNSHSHKDIPWAFIGSGLGFKGGRMVDAGGVPHNRLLLSIAHGMGLTNLSQFGNPDFCNDGPIQGLS